MDIDHFVRIVHSLSATPSRRAAIRGLAGLTAGSFLAPFTDSATAKRRGGKKKHHKKRKRTTQVCQEADGPTCHFCPEGQGHCPFDGQCCAPEECGNPCGCCRGINSRGVKMGCCEIDGTCCRVDGCTVSCGCCPEGETPNCCPGPVNRLCFDMSQEQCCPPAAGSTIVGLCPKPLACKGSVAGIPWCCESGSTQCAAGAGCCPANSYCCPGGRCCDNVGCEENTSENKFCFPEVFGQAARIA